MAVPFDALGQDLRDQPLWPAQKAAQGVAGLAAGESGYAPDVEWVWDAHDEHAAHLEHPIYLLDRERCSLQVFERFLQGDAIDRRVRESKLIDAHLLIAVPYLGIEEASDADIILEIIYSGYGLAGKAAGGLAHERAGETANVHHCIALDAIQDLDVPVR
jgi:hypothetical protein